MRFGLASDGKGGPVEQTPLINLSESGVAFLVSPGTEIALGDMIKVEIPIPAGEQIAWYGRVVRLQEYKPETWLFSKDPFREEKKILVGVNFNDLPEGHSRAIRKGIEQSFMKAMRDQHYRNWLYYRRLALENVGKFILYTFLAACAAAFLHFVTRPSGNYDAEKGAPWGERFKF